MVLNATFELTLFLLTNYATTLKVLFRLKRLRALKKYQKGALLEALHTSRQKRILLRIYQEKANYINCPHFHENLERKHFTKLYMDVVW